MKKILAIDDQIDNLITIKAVIKSHISNCDVLTALSGRDGIDIAIKEQPDAILLDIIMPKMDGYETCKKLKENELTKHIPVVMVTAIKTDSESRVKGLNIGADAFLSKPIDAIELTAQVKVMLRIKEAEDKLRAEKVLLEEIVTERTHKLKESEQKYKTLYNFGPIPYQSLNEDGSINDVNPSWLEMLGYDREEVIGKLYEDFIHPEDKAVLQKNFPVLINQGQVHDVPFRLKHKDGHYFDISLEGCSAYNADGSFKQTYCVFQDITKRKQTEKQIRKLSTAVEQSPSVIVITDLEGKIEYVNPKFSELTGYTNEEVIGNNTRILKSGEQSIKVYKELWENISLGKEWHGEFHNKKKNGELFWEMVSISPIIDAEGNTTNYLKVAEDITNRKKAEEALKESTLNFKLIFENSPIGIYMATKNGDIIDANQSLLTILGSPSIEATKAINVLEFPPLVKNSYAAKFKQCIKEVKTIEFEMNYKSKWSKEATLHSFLVPLLDSEGSVSNVYTLIEDITERKNAENAVQKSESVYRNLVELLPDGVYKSTEAGVFVDVNPALVSMLGYASKEELMAIDIKTQLYFEIADRESAVLQENKEETGVYRMKKKDGSEIWVEDHGWLTVDKDTKAIFHEGILRDITERKRSDELLRASEERYKNFISQVSEGVYRFELKEPMSIDLHADEQIDYLYDNMIIAECNQAFMDMYGIISLEDIIGKTQKQMHGGSDNQKNREAVRKFIASGYRSENNETLEPDSNGNIRYFSNNSIGIIKDGYLIRTWGTQVDITERVKADTIKQVLFEISKAASSTIDLPELIEIIRFELGKLIETTNFYIAFYDEKTRMLTASAALFDEEDEIETWPAEKSATGYVIKYEKSLLASYDDILKLAAADEIEIIGTHSKVWLGVPIKSDNKVIGALVVQSYNNPNAYTEEDKLLLEFISNHIGTSIGRKKAEELLRKSEERFNLAMKASNDGLYDWNLVTNEVYYSARWKSILGYNDDELPNDISIWESLSHQEEKEESLFKLHDAIDKKIVHYNVEFRMKHKLGHWVNILSRAQIIYNEEGKAIRAVGTHSDLTEQKQAEQNLRSALIRAEESDRLKSAFLANMSHEIRTPMNGILGFADLLKLPDLSGDEQQSYISVIEKSGHRMLNIINDIVDISKIESGQMQAFISETNVNEQIEFIYSFFEAETKNKGIQLSMKNSLPSIKANIRTDREKLYAILTNLVKNAIKYTRKGSIEFGYNLKQAKLVGESGELEFYVKDTGLGIPLNRQGAIFERFIQADIGDKMALQGAGLGLAISKAYVEMLGGKIWVESTSGQGSIFYFTIPYTLVQDENS